MIIPPCWMQQSWACRTRRSAKNLRPSCLKADVSATGEELRRWLSQRIAALKVPVRIAYWPKTWPRNANGKTMKGELKAAFPDLFACS